MPATCQTLHGTSLNRSTIPEKTRRTAKKERIDIRIPAETKEVIRSAAQIRGMNTSDFIISAAYEAAEKTILGLELMRLDPEQSTHVAESLLNLGEPDEALRNLLRNREPAKELVG